MNNVLVPSFKDQYRATEMNKLN